MWKTGKTWVGRLLTAVLLLGVSLQGQAQTAHDLLDSYREWMKTNYPKPEGLDREGLFRETLWALYNGQREPEVKALLGRTIQTVPELHRYAEWLESGKNDPRLEVRIAAFEALARAAGKQLGADNVTTGWCRLMALHEKGMMQNVTADMEKLAADLEQQARRKPDRGHRALLCAARLMGMQDALWDAFVEEPESYDGLLETEKTVLELYPPGQQTADHTRAFVYRLLAQAKSVMSHRLEANLAQERYKSLVVGTWYQLLNNGVSCNSDYYFQQAVETYNLIYPEGHPEVSGGLYKDWCSFICNNLVVDEETVRDCQLLRDYTDLYYPAGSLECLLARTNLWACRMRAGMDNPDAVFCTSVMESLKQCLGEDNYYYLNLLTVLAPVAVYHYPMGAERILDSLDALIDRRYAEEPLKRAFLMNVVYVSLKDRLPERAQARMEQSYALYRAHHDSSILSVTLGRSIVWDCQNSTANYEVALEMQGYVCSDVAQRYGATSEIYFMEELSKIMLTGWVDYSRPGELYPDLLARMKAAGADCSQVENAYADYEYRMGNFEKAEKLFEQLIGKQKVEDIPDQRCWQLLAYVNTLGYTGGREAERAKCYAEARKLMVGIKDSVNFQSNNFLMATDYLMEQGRYREAVDLLDQGIRLSQWQTGGNILDQTYLSMIARKNEILYENLNEMVEAKRLIAQQLSDYNPERMIFYTPDVLDFLYRCYRLMVGENGQDFEQALALIQPIVAITQKLLVQSGQNSNFLMRYGTQMVGVVVNYLLNMQQAKRTLDTGRLSDEQLKSLEQGERVVDNVRTQMKTMMDYLKNLFPQADPNYRENGDYVSLVYYLSNYYQWLEPDAAKALAYLKEYATLLDKLPLGSAYAWVALGDFYLEQKQTAQAAAAYAEAGKRLESQGQASASDRVFVEGRLCAVYQQQGQPERMLEHARKFYASVKEIMDGNFQLMTEKEQNNFMQKYQDPAGWLTALLEVMPDKLAGEVYDAVLYRTGMQLRSQRQTKQAIREAGDRELTALLDSLDRLRTEQRSMAVNYYANVPGQAGEGVMQQNRLTYAIDALERRIIEASEPYRRKYVLNATWKDVQGRLKPGEAAIEFVYSDKHVMALVVRPDSRAPQPVQLVANDSLSGSLAALGVKTSARMAMKLYNERAVDLYGMLWKPIEPWLEGVKTVYFTAPGILNNLSFAAFATPDGGYLTDKYRLCQLTTTAALLARQDGGRPRSALLMGDIYYSDRQQRLADAGRKAEARGADDDFGLDDFDGRGVSREHFKYLPFTGDELANIGNELGKNGGLTAQTVVRTGTQATEQAFRELAAARPEVIHLATHGFFLANDRDLQRIPYYRLRMQNMDNSMRRAGVALAGAEATWCGAEGNDTDDGILTADEVARFDLTGTKLVVLSACETALGDYSFEGVYGLPRGFKQAGAKALLVSLWSVNDRSTALLMSEFYRGWLGGQTPRQALEQAVKAVRKQYPEPYYWAPFVLME